MTRWDITRHGGDIWLNRTTGEGVSTQVKTICALTYATQKEADEIVETLNEGEKAKSEPKRPQGKGQSTRKRGSAYGGRPPSGGKKVVGK